MMWMSDSRSASESALDAGFGAADSFLSGLVFSPALASFFLCCSLLISSCVVVLEKAIRLPSGDQTGQDAPFDRSVIIRASPPDSGRIAICAGRGLPLSSLSPTRTNAMRVPSGDQRALASCLPLVRRSGDSAPEVATIQIEVS